MADPSIFDPLRIPSQTLAALDWRPFHFALQPYHYLVRMTHIIAMSAFFGGIGLLDFRLMGWRGTVPLRGFADHVLPWLWVTFGIAVVTGLALFFYDPMHVGAHAYWVPKLITILLGLANAAMFHRTTYVAALAAETHVPTSARLAGAVSLACWTAAVAFACLDTEGIPKVLLR
jgi:nitroreductase